jgi:hypothetical protein
MTLDSLTAVRVIAEFFVVHYHLGEFYPGQKGEGDFYVEDLMSLFFVLSGFVAMHTHPASVQAMPYYRKRIGKSYPTYVIWLLADLPGAYISQHHCNGYEYLSLTQLIPISPWLGSSHILNVNGVSWYMATLFWLWLIFPLLHTPISMACDKLNPWAVVLLAYALSLLACVLTVPLYYQHIRTLPVLRVFEFIMGACSALAINTKTHWLAPLLTLGGLVLLWVITGNIEDSHGLKICSLWPTRQELIWDHIGPASFISLPCGWVCAPARGCTLLVSGAPAHGRAERGRGVERARTGFRAVVDGPGIPSVPAEAGSAGVPGVILPLHGWRTVRQAVSLHPKQCREPEMYICTIMQANRAGPNLRMDAGQ